MSISKSVFHVILIVNLVNILQVSGCLKKAGQNAAEAIGTSFENSAKELSSSLEATTQLLTSSFNRNVDETANAIRHLSSNISEIAKNIQIRIDSGDLENLGEAATKNLKEAFTELSKNWELALNTAHLKDIGAEATRHLSEAIQNINVHVGVTFGITPEVERAIMYISIAAGIAFSVLFVAIVVSIKSCRSCTMTLCGLCIKSCKSKENEEKDKNVNKNDDDKEGVRIRNNKEQEMQSLMDIKGSLNNLKSSNQKFEMDDAKIYENNDKSAVSKRDSMQGYNYSKFRPVLNYWQKKDNNQ